jgi:uncharacterized radical SAM superfamily Fe-S cluster-containing enzyme
MELLRKLEKAIARTADAAWPVMQIVNRLGPTAEPFQPSWTDEPIPRGAERSAPQLGCPRETDSLCPECVKDVRRRIQAGELDWRQLAEDHPGQIKATIRQKDGQVVMEKRCPTHGPFEDLIAIDPAFLTRIESLFPGRDVRTSLDDLHDHGSSSIRYGRGGVLTVDLTNRCNMMCEHCFMDSNQIGYVHELEWEEIKTILDASATVRPRRQMSVQFSGGEPTLSPHFIDAIRYAREVGYFAVQCATNGLRFAQEPGFAKKCHDAGLRIAYLQFDGVTNESNSHRKIGNLYDVKLRAIEELSAAGIDIILVVTVIGGMNDDQVGPIVEFAVDNADKITVISFQPVSFTGRDEDISPELRRQQRYTLSHLARDVARQTGYTDPLRDWFPLSALSPFGDVCDLIDGTSKTWGQLKCGCHPGCGVGTVLFVNKRTKQAIPLLDFLDVEGILQDMATVFDAGKSAAWSKAQLVASVLRHFDADGAPEGFHLHTLLKQFLSQTGVAHAGEDDAEQYDWRVLFVAGMAFQDVFNYDFRRTEMCIIPYGTEHGEISFCAYNTGVGWRNIIEKMHAKASVADWHRQHGKHPVYADGRDLPIIDGKTTIIEHRLAVEERARGAQPHGGEAQPETAPAETTPPIAEASQAPAVA